MPLRFIILSIFFAVPFTASAATLLEWNFVGEVPGQWDVFDYKTVTLQDNGLLIPADKDGYIVTNTNFKRSADAVALTLQTNQTMEALLMWKDPSISKEGFITLPFLIEGSPEEQMINIDLSTSSVWSGFPVQFALAFPKGSEVLLKHIEFFRWNPIAKLGHGFLSFWTFDTFRSHSINFLWGPWLTFNPIARTDMHMTDPPFGTSGTWVFFILLTLGGAVCFMQRKRVQPITLFLITFAGLWLLYDLRMGTELLSYVRNDWVFLKGNIGERTFRAHHNMPDIADMSTSILKNEEFYLFVGAEPYYFSEMRYRTYPALPVQGGDNANRAKLGLVFGRDDVSLDEEGLRVAGEIVREGGGSVLQTFDEYSSLIQFD